MSPSPWLIADSCFCDGALPPDWNHPLEFIAVRSCATEQRLTHQQSPSSCWYPLRLLLLLADISFVVSAGEEAAGGRGRMECRREEVGGSSSAFPRQLHLTLTTLRSTRSTRSTGRNAFRSPSTVKSRVGCDVNSQIQLRQTLDKPSISASTSRSLAVLRSSSTLS